MNSRNIKDVEQLISLYGYKNFDLYKLDDDTLKTIKEIVELDIPEFEGVQLSYISKRTLKNNAKRFFDEKLLLRNVSFLSDKKILSLHRKSNIYSFDDIEQIFNDSGVYISPFAIPISFIKNSVFAGTLETQFLKTEENPTIYFNRVFLSKYITNIATSCYIHEIMHSQLESQRGSIENFYNSEVLSIFMEMLYAYERNDIMYYMILAIRITHLCSSFNRMYLYQTDQMTDEKYKLFDYCKDGAYFNSIMKAFNLLEKYINGSHNEQKLILIQLQRVIKGNKTVENMLNGLDVTYESSLNSEITNKLLKA